MIADERSNSLLDLCVAERTWRSSRKSSRNWIRSCRRCLIEAVIIEVNLNDGRNLGVSYLEKQFANFSGYFQGIGAINNGNFLNPHFALRRSNAGGQFPGGFQLSRLARNDLDIVVTAVANDSRAEILQRPTNSDFAQ